MMGDARGLTSAEVAERHSSGRGNTASTTTSRSVAGILRENVLTLFNGILTVCFVAVLLLGDLRDGFFYGIVVVNALIGIVQELRAKIVLDRLALLAQPESRVRRDGAVVSVPVASVVEDEILVLRPGDQIPADAVVVEGTGLSLDESMLTGESDPVVKDEGQELLSGSHVVAGTGQARVTAVGAASYAGRLTSEIRRHSLVHSELRYATNRILVYLSWILGPVILLVLVGRVFAYGGIAELLGTERWRSAIIDAVASVVGMIPEGLVLLISLAFGVAAIQLAARKVLVQELAAVEVLARVDVLCLDKTGTLTSGELGFDRLVTLGAVPERESATAMAAFGSDDSANATAGILARHFTAAGVTVVRRLPFSSATRFSAVTFEHAGARSSWYLGAPERLLTSPEHLQAAEHLATAGMRTLALARCPADLPEDPAVSPRDLGLTAAALVTFRETLRPEAPDTLRYFEQQGTRVVVMSGDSPATVGAIAGAIGLRGPAVDASTLLDDDALAHALEESNVFGRVSPEQKRRAVHLLQARGRTVGMTGDGVNDAMAIKDADLGIAMGTATAATKAVSRIVLLDNRFDRLPKVLELGRRVIANVERVANIFLAKTVYGILLSLFSTAALVPFPFLPRQLTLVSALAIGIPSFALALAPNRRIYTPGVLRRIIRYSIPTGTIAAAACVACYLPLLHALPLGEARSLTTVALFCVSLWIVCVLARPLSGPRLALIVGVAAVFVLVCWVPLGRSFFKIEIVPSPGLLYALAIGALGAAAIEVFYRLARSRGLVFDRE